MRAWIVAVAATAVLAGLAGCGSDRPADQQDVCSAAVNDALNGLGGSVSVDVRTANTFRTGIQHDQAMVDAQTAATAWHAKLLEQANRDVSPELRQVLQDGAKMVAAIMASLEDVLSVPPAAEYEIKSHAGKIQDACADAWS